MHDFVDKVLTKHTERLQRFGLTAWRTIEAGDTVHGIRVQGDGNHYARVTLPCASLADATARTKVGHAPERTLVASNFDQLDSDIASWADRAAAAEGLDVRQMV